MRTIDEIQQIFAQKCMSLGELHWRQKVIKHQIEETIRAIELLDQEAYAIKKASAASENTQQSTTTAENTQQE